MKNCSIRPRIDDVGSVHPAYNPSFIACFSARTVFFLSQQISQQRFSADLSAQPNGAVMGYMYVKLSQF
jgi:hypothetical protein